MIDTNGVRTVPPAVALSRMTKARDLAHAEVAKLLSTRTVRWVIIAELALIALAESGAVESGGISSTKLATSGGVRLLLGHGGLAAVMTLIIGVTISAGEYRHGTIADTFLSTPRRTPVLLAKFWIAAIVGLLAGVLSSAVALATALIWYSEKGVSFGASDGTVVRTLAGVTAWHVLYAVIGVALGALMRAQSAAIVTALVWIFIAETAVASLAVSLGRWLPGTAARGLGYDPSSGLLAQAGGGVVLTLWAAALCAGAVVVISRRDVV
jgi:ABC-2 type transport system permease protein